MTPQSVKDRSCRHPVMDIETGLCVDCGEPIDCPPILDFGVEPDPPSAVTAREQEE
jgi:hypothetical protein